MRTPIILMPDAALATWLAPGRALLASLSPACVLRISCVRAGTATGFAGSPKARKCTSWWPGPSLFIGGLAAEILHLDFSSFCVAQWCSARIAIHEAFRVLPDTHVLRGVFRALGIVPGYPIFTQFCAESVLYLRFSPVKKFARRAPRVQAGP